MSPNRGNRATDSVRRLERRAHSREFAEPTCFTTAAFADSVHSMLGVRR